MKRVKVMLLAIAVIAIAAGTLAFKARYNVDFCYGPATTTQVGGPLTCKVAGVVTQTCTIVENGLILSSTAPTDFVCTTSYTTTEVGEDPICLDTDDCARTKISLIE